jgi:hypothetical protein
MCIYLVCDQILDTKDSRKVVGRNKRLHAIRVIENVTCFRHGCVCLMLVAWLMAAVPTLCVGQTGRGVKGKALPPSSGYLEGEG